MRIPIRPNGSSAYHKVERRAGDWAVVSAGAAVWIDNGTISQGRVGLAAVGANTNSIADAAAALAGANTLRGALRPGRCHRPPLRVIPKPTDEAPPTTSATWPTN